jgi:hypothetical protein
MVTTWPLKKITSGTSMGVCIGVAVDVGVGPGLGVKMAMDTGVGEVDAVGVSVGSGCVHAPSGTALKARRANQ